MGGVRILPVGLARNDNTDRRLLRFHGVDLNRRRVGTQQLALAIFVRREKECVVHFPRRMAFREIQCGEVVIIGLDIGTFGNRETHIGENRSDLVNHLADRVNAATLSGR